MSNADEFGTDVRNIIVPSSRKYDIVAVLLTMFCLFHLGIRIWSVKRSFMRFICVGWIVLMPIVCFVNHSTLFVFARTILWPLLFLCSYLYSRYYNKAFNILQILMFFFFIGGLFIFIQKEMSGVASQTNTVYFSFFIIPWILSVKGRINRMAMLVLFTLLAVISMKRAMMFPIVIIWIIEVLVTEKKRKRKKGLRLFSFIFIALLLFLLFYYVNSVSDGGLFDRIFKEETNTGRNRLAIWEVTIAMILRSDMFSLLLGHGHGGVANDSPLEIAAHNDFLECFYDYGIIVLVLYFMLCVYVAKKSVSLFRAKSSYSLPFFASVAVFFFQSMFEHLLYYCSWFFYLVIYWGCIEGMLSSRYYQIKQRQVIKHKYLKSKKEIPQEGKR